MLTSSAIILTVNLQSDRTSSLTLAVLSPVRVANGRPLRCSSSTRVLPSENILCRRKACVFDIVSSPKACWSFPCAVVALSPSLTHTKDGIPLCDVRCFHFRDEVHKHHLTCQAPTPHWGIAQPCHCKWGSRKDQGQRLSVLADCSIACTARRKLVSLLYCWTLYNVNFATLSDPNKLSKHNKNSAEIIHLWNIYNFAVSLCQMFVFSAIPPSPVGKDHKVSV